MKRVLIYVSILVLMILAVAAFSAQFVTATPPAQPDSPSDPMASGQEYTLQTAMRDGRMVYVGVGGTIDGVVNPELVAQPGEPVRIALVNGDGMPHDFSIDGLGVKTPLLTAKGATADVLISVTQAQAGTYDYFCTVSGHRQAGMAGQFIVR